MCSLKCSKFTQGRRQQSRYAKCSGFRDLALDGGFCTTSQCGEEELFILRGQGKGFDVSVFFFFVKVGSAVSVLLVLSIMSSRILFVEVLE